MMEATELGHGLRHILIYLDIDGNFPPRKNSKADIALLRAANLAMRRKAQGVSDSFLFILANAGSRCHDTILSYGFPDAEIAVFSPNILKQTSLLGDEGADQYLCSNIREELISEIEPLANRWLSEKHPGAIPFLNNQYHETNFWWIGVEHNDDVTDWPFTPESFANELPRTHQSKAATWLSVLAQALEIDTIQTSSQEIIADNLPSAFAATLCEWLHGFEGASGNGYNDFDAESVMKSLNLSEFYVGFEAARLSSVDLEDFCDEYEVEGTPGAAALKLITRDLREHLVNALLDFFGGEARFFWTMHSSIWPKLDEQMHDAFENLIRLKSQEYAELENAWLFVSDGWHESADD